MKVNQIDGGNRQMVTGTIAPPDVRDTLNSFRHYDAEQLRIQLEWVAEGRARLLVNGEPLLSDAGLPLTLFTSRAPHVQARRRQAARQARRTAGLPSNHGEMPHSMAS